MMITYRSKSSLKQSSWRRLKKSLSRDVDFNVQFQQQCDHQCDGGDEGISASATEGATCLLLREEGGDCLGHSMRHSKGIFMHIP